MSISDSIDIIENKNLANKNVTIIIMLINVIAIIITTYLIRKAYI
jgi:hypothetical protein